MLTSMAHEPFQANSDTIYVSKLAVAKILNCSISTIDRFRRAGNFPSHRQIGPRSIVWSKSEILNWVETKKVAAKN